MGEFGMRDRRAYIWRSRPTSYFPILPQTAKMLTNLLWLIGYKTSLILARKHVKNGSFNHVDVENTPFLNLL